MEKTKHNGVDACPKQWKSSVLVLTFWDRNLILAPKVCCMLSCACCSYIYINTDRIIGNWQKDVNDATLKYASMFTKSLCGHYTTSLTEKEELEQNSHNSFTFAILFLFLTLELWNCGHFSHSNESIFCFTRTIGLPFESTPDCGVTFNRCQKSVVNTAF